MTEQRECPASVSGSCLAEVQGEPGCATRDGECVYAGRIPVRQYLAETDPLAVYVMRKIHTLYVTERTRRIVRVSTRKYRSRRGRRK